MFVVIRALNVLPHVAMQILVASQEYVQILEDPIHVVNAVNKIVR